MEKKHAWLGAVLIGSLLLFSGCKEASETVEDVAANVEEKIQAETTKDNEHLLAVKGGTLGDYPDVLIEDAFGAFFSDPTWKFFEAETGELIVEFTGYCTYMEKEVKAKLQFIVEEGVDTFDIGALQFNEVPQTELVKAALIEAIYEEQLVTDEVSEDVIEKVSNSSLDTPFALGEPLADLYGYYGDPTYDDYFMGGRLVVFDEQDGYFLDENENIAGFFIGNANVDILGTYVGMAADDIVAVLGEPADSYFDGAETQSYVHTFYVEGYKISYYSEEEFGPTNSVIIMPN